jgi:DNA-directed RNA polymerase subunit RPC12/RpoP
MDKVARKSLIDVQREFATEEQCLAYLEHMRWPNGVRCPKCRSNRISKFRTNGSTRTRRNRKTGKVTTVTVPPRYLYECLNSECGHQFSATAGTIFNDTHLSLPQWFMAVALMVNAKKGLSAKQMERDLGVSYPTAWYLCHRIRKAMEEGEPGSAFIGTVEADETYLGGRYDKRRKRGPYEKQPVMGFLQRAEEERCSQVRAFPIATNSAKIIGAAVTRNVAINADVFITDQSGAYTSVGRFFRHETVNHIALEYVRRGDPRQIHTNSIENFWSLFKRGLIGSYHQVSVKHLRRYLDEFSFRFNNRDAEDLFGLVVLNLVIAAGIKRSELMANPAEADVSDEPF